MQWCELLETMKIKIVELPNYRCQYGHVCQNYHHFGQLAHFLDFLRSHKKNNTLHKVKYEKTNLEPQLNL